MSRKEVPELIYANVRIRMEVRRPAEQQLRPTAVPRPTIRQRIGALAVKAACRLGGFTVWTFAGRPLGETPDAPEIQKRIARRKQEIQQDHNNPN